MHVMMPLGTHLWVHSQQEILIVDIKMHQFLKFIHDEYKVSTHVYHHSSCLVNSIPDM